jgi:two-component system KDP operon response regulator KdpE
MAEKILIVEDSQVLRQSLVRLLEAEAYEVAEAGDGLEGLAQASRFGPDLVVMDINMPRMDGLQALQHLRESSTVPVLMLSVRSSQPDKVVGLDTGADDYLGKPFGVEEFLARVRALLRRRRVAEPRREGSRVLRLGGGELTIDLAERRVLLSGQLVQLTPLEGQLLFTLAEQAGAAVSREELLKAVWPDDPEATYQNLKLYILYLRRKIEPDPAQPRYLMTVRGTGYRLATV